ARSRALRVASLPPGRGRAPELAARLLGENGELRRASRIIEKAWQANPHPELADAYAHLRVGDAARERSTGVQSWVRKMPSHAEGALAVARAALDAQEFAAAREALKPLLREPTQRTAELMAEIERRESGDEGRAREWMARALRAPHDLQWTAEGVVSDRGLPVSASGRLDAFQWKVPLAELADAREVIEGDDAPRDVTPAVVKRDAEPEAPPAVSDSTGAPAALPSSRPAPRQQRSVERNVE